MYSAWQVPTCLLFEFCCGANIAISIEFWACELIMQILPSLNEDPMDWRFFTSMAFVHTVPLITCITQAMLSNIKLRVEDWKYVAFAASFYVVANYLG